MVLSTAFTELFSMRHPIALAPMGGSAGGALAAAVSNGGGLGLIGGGNGDRDWLARELPIVAQGTESGGHGARRGRSTLTPSRGRTGSGRQALTVPARQGGARRGPQVRRP